MNSIPIDQLSIGDAKESRKTVSETDVYLFAGISGDFNPMHVDHERPVVEHRRGAMRVVATERGQPCGSLLEHSGGLTILSHHPVRLGQVHEYAQLQQLGLKW